MGAADPKIATKMKITNQNNLPEPLVRAVLSRQREPKPGQFSVTELLKPPQMRALTLQHQDDITEDASDRLWALLGSLTHEALESHAQGIPNVFSEQELKTTIAGHEIIGHYDLSEMVLDGETLTDYKLTSVWAAKDGIKREWEEQTNCYAELIRRSDRHVAQIQIVAIYRDWSKSKAKFDPSYPQQQVQVFAVPLWTSEQAVDFLEERVALHQRAARGDYDECTPQERWAKETEWAVMKAGQKRAVKLYLNQDLAMRHAASAKDLSVVERPGESRRCESYCAAAPFCKQYQESKPSLAKQLAASLEELKKTKAA